MKSKYFILICISMLHRCGSDEGNLYLDGSHEPEIDAVHEGVVDIPVADTFPDTNTDGTISDNCIERAKWIYLVAHGKQLIQFKPDDLSLTVIGTLNCPVSGRLSAPFSMSVDRNATAWILYTDFTATGGELFKVSTIDANCQSTTFQKNQHGFQVFGMGFVSDCAGCDEETLYVAGGAEFNIAMGNATLGYIDMSSLILTPIAPVAGWPELTGTGLGELWGFFPENNPPCVQKIDKSTGAISNTYNLPMLDTGMTEAWAFAFWGGDFYLFLQTTSDRSTNIWRLETDDGSLTEVVHDTGYKIVGAGVSTCAPVTVI